MPNLQWVRNYFKWDGSNSSLPLCHIANSSHTAKDILALQCIFSTEVYTATFTASNNKRKTQKKKIMYKKMKEERSDLARLGQKTEAEEKKKINSATFVSTFTASGFWLHSFIPFDSFFFICLLLLLLVWCLVNACCAKNTSKQCNIHG